MEQVTANTRYLTKELIHPGKINILKSLCGTGKTRAIRDFLSDLPIRTSLIVPTFRRTLCSFLVGEFENVTSYITCKDKIISPASYPRVCISPESFWRYRDEDGSCPVPDVLILDEICSLFEHLLNTSTIKGEQRSYFIDVISLFMKQPSCTVIICDAYFSDNDLDIIRRMTEDDSRIRYVVNEYSEKKYKMYLYTKAEGGKMWKQMFKKYAADDEQKLYVFSSSKKLLLGLETEYGNNRYEDVNKDTFTEHTVGDKRKIISADSTDGEKEIYSSQPDGEESWSANRILYVSPTIQAGVSFTKEHFNKSFGAAVNGCGSINSFLQQMMRPRNIVDKEIHVFLPWKMSKLSRMKALDEVNEDNVWDRLQLLEKWTHMKISQLIEKDLTVVDKRVAVRPSAKSILNHILVNYSVKLFRQKQNYIREFKSMLKNDWYDIIDVNEDVFDEMNGSKNLVEKNIIATFENATQYITKMFNNISWDGKYPDDETVASLKGGAFSQLMQFINYWGVLGVLGDVEELYKPKFNTARLSSFFLRTVSHEFQLRFHTFLMKSSETHLINDMEESQYNSFTFDTLLYSTMVVLFGEYGIFESKEMKGITEEQINYFDDRTYQVSGYKSRIFVMNESLVNSKASFERICDMLKKSWFHVTRLLSVNLPTVCPEWVDTKLISTTALKELRKITDACLRYIGLKRGSSKLDMVREDVFFKPEIDAMRKQTKGKRIESRIRVRTYRIENIKLRLSISAFRLMKTNSRKTDHPNNIMPDPLLLLDWSARSESITPEWKYWEGYYPNPYAYRFWPLKMASITPDWCTSVKEIWGDVQRQQFIMTNDNNVLSRMKYWLSNPDTIEQDLPEDYTANPPKFSY